MAEGRLAAALNHAASWVKSNPKDAIALQDGPHVDLADTGRSAAAKRKSLSIVRPRGSETNCARRKAPHLIRLFRGSWCCSLAAVIDDGSGNARDVENRGDKPPRYLVGFWHETKKCCQEREQEIRGHSKEWKGH